MTTKEMPRLQIPVEPEVLDQLKELAWRKRTNLSVLIRSLVDRELTENGMVPQR